MSDHVVGGIATVETSRLDHRIADIGLVLVGKDVVVAEHEGAIGVAAKAAHAQTQRPGVVQIRHHDAAAATAEARPDVLGERSTRPERPHLHHVGRHVRDLARYPFRFSERLVLILGPRLSSDVKLEREISGRFVADLLRPDTDAQHVRIICHPVDYELILFGTQELLHNLPPIFYRARSTPISSTSVGIPSRSGGTRSASANADKSTFLSTYTLTEN
jgi:hypothetical protein